ncbi:MAG: DedA family protein [Corynebacterium sp.]|uniref:DedA family protein n=1 Tax=Corynebacterium sp. TaxID=1720 RepID=UPI0026DF2F6B|nr:DedA family protein [Corynebacterium sp.]MDO5671042.1 DedA family protein [Corynebacterium sp.]
MLSSIVDWVVRLMELLGAPGVGIAILLENLFPPIPSEVVLPLAGFTASQGELNVWAAFIWATIGSVTGALLLYWVGAAIGAGRLRQIADWMWLVEPEDVDKALHWFDRYGRWSVFFGRLIPGVRSLISIPAGIDRMNPLSFGLMTFAGSALWNAVLIYAGVVLGDNYHLVEKYVGEYSTWVYVTLGIALVVVVFLLGRRARRRSRQGKADTQGTTR